MRCRFHDEPQVLLLQVDRETGCEIRFERLGPRFWSCQELPAAADGIEGFLRVQAVGDRERQSLRDA